MSLRSVIRLTALVGLAASCASPTEPGGAIALEHRPLLGEWIADPVILGPVERYTQSLTLRANGTFILVNRHFGAYGGQDADDQSSFNYIEGDFALDGDRVDFRAKRITEWDLIQPGDSKARSRSYEVTIFDDGRVALHGDRLTLSYLSFPADAPVPTTMVYQRAVTVH